MHNKSLGFWDGTLRFSEDLMVQSSSVQTLWPTGIMGVVGCSGCFQKLYQISHSPFPDPLLLIYWVAKEIKQQRRKICKSSLTGKIDIAPTPCSNRPQEIAALYFRLIESYIALSYNKCICSICSLQTTVYPKEKMKSNQIVGHYLKG